SYQSLFFTETEPQFKTSDGVTVLVTKLWETLDSDSQKSDLEQLAERAKKYGIVVNKFEPRSSFTRGTYSLDVIQPLLASKLSGKASNSKIPNAPPVAVEKKKKTSAWIWLLILLALGLLFLWFSGYFKSNKEATGMVNPAPDTVYKEKIITRVDTVFVEAIEELESKFNSVQYQVKKYDIPEEAKYALYDLAKILVKHPEVMLKVEGHTSKEGNPQFNKTLSEKRAQSVVAFLIDRGVDSTHLSYEGMGSSMPLDSVHVDKNRRTEFVILSK
ncbi:MAG: OmpA family protein, partial [Bacteroidota bacterium]